MSRGGVAFTVFREFLPEHFSGRTVSVRRDIYPAVKGAFPDLCSDRDLCGHESPHRPEWQHQVREALEYLHLNQHRIVHVKRGVWMFP